MLFSYPLMAAIQEISGRIGRTTGRGVAGNIPAWLLNAIVGLLFIANTINIGADLGAMGDALSLLVGGPHRFLCRARGCLCVVLQIFVPYKRYVSVLKWLTLSLFAYFGTVMPDRFRLKVFNADSRPSVRSAKKPSFSRDRWRDSSLGAWWISCRQWNVRDRR